MKATRYFKSALLAGITALTLFIPGTVFAGNTLVKSTGVSDESLFVILICVAIIQLVAITVIAGVIKAVASQPELWRWQKGAAPVVTMLLLLTAPQARAADARFSELITMDDTGFVALITINLVLFFTLIYLTAKLNMLLKMMVRDEGGKVPASFMSKINALLTRSVPMEKESTIEMEHEYDGIRELDNKLPPWWLYGFYFTIAFAIVYMVHYHITGTGELQLTEYQNELEKAEVMKTTFMATQEAAVDENSVVMLTEAPEISAGEKLFKLNCVGCHGQTGGSMPGGVGPNLTDDYWIHGGALGDIFKSIKYGIPTKGMQSWEKNFTPVQIQQLASYIKSIRGSNPENAKEPQGELWQESAEIIEQAPADSANTSTSAG